MSAPKSKATKAARKSIDFDKIRQERDITLGEIPPVKIGGKHYRLAPSMPLSVTERFAKNSKVDDKTGDVSILLDDMQAILEELFGETQWAAIKRHIDIADVPDLFTVVFDAYGESVGEASNSGES